MYDQGRSFASNIYPLGFAFQPYTMEQKLFEKLFTSWKEKELANQKAGKRRYLHFDAFIDFKKNAEFFYKYFQNGALKIPKHGFYPFIKADIITPRIRHEKDVRTGKQIVIKKDKVRPISYAAHFDAYIYSWYAHLLTHFYTNKIKEANICDSILAYLEKDKKNNIDFAFEVFDHITKRGECVALAFDLSSFFDNLDHVILKKQWCDILNLSKLPPDHFTIFKTLTDYSYIQKDYLTIRFPRPMGKGYFYQRICDPSQFREMVQNGQTIEKNPFINLVEGSKRFGETCGIPQGTPISACLSNIYLLEFDKTVCKFASKKNALYRRYCDDLLIVCDKKEAEFFQTLFKKLIKKYEVLINDKKTELIHFKKEGEYLNAYSSANQRRKLQYLGFEFDGSNIFIRSASMSRYHRRMSSKIGQAVADAYCKDFGQQDFVFRKDLFLRYTDKGRKNFIVYGYQAKEKMKSKTIHNQVKNSMLKVEKLIGKKILMKEKVLKYNNIPFKPKK